MSSLFSMMRNDFMPASRSLMAIQRPEKPAPTMRTSTFGTAEFAEGAEGSVMRETSLPCSVPRVQRECGGTRRLLIHTDRRARRLAIAPRSRYYAHRMGRGTHPADYRRQGKKRG